MNETFEQIGRWAERRGCSLCVLFGSAADERVRAPRDLDVAVALDPLPAPLERLRMIGEVQELAAALRTDLVFLHRATDPVLRFEIFRGRPLHEAREGLFVDEKVRALMLYEDALPFRRALRRRIARRPAPAEDTRVS